MQAPLGLDCCYRHVRSRCRNWLPCWMVVRGPFAFVGSLVPRHHEPIGALRVTSPVSFLLGHDFWLLIEVGTVMCCAG